MSFSPRACSGDAYSGVQWIRPSEVRCGRSRTSRQRPKSQTLAAPSPVRRTFWGLTSRWMTLWAQAYWSASATPHAISSASASGSGPRERRYWSRGFPSTNSMTM